MNDKKYKVVVVPVEKSPYEDKMSFNDIVVFVKDYVEQIHLYDNIYALVDENATLKVYFKINRTVVLQDKSIIPCTLFNDFVLIRCKNGEMMDMTNEEIKEALFIFRSTNPDAVIFI
ncbi:MAG: hypothetical protein K0R54_556 [Clostridiaceae bacterium]|jgi:hypothetical protein|nr:hypothetical protein [Clostridiaceae bacterium]